MRHFDFLTGAERRRLFAHEPEPFDATSERTSVASALGATLYCPATRTDLAADLARQAADGVASMVVCLEDAIADADVTAAETASRRRNSGVRPQAEGRCRWCSSGCALPVRSCCSSIALGPTTEALTGFVLPKFTEDSGPEFLDAVVDASERRRPPVVRDAGRSRSHEMRCYLETRVDALLAMRRVVDKYRDHVLAVRVGATDLSSAYGLRRSRDLTIYDVRVVADVIADIVNVFCRADTRLCGERSGLGVLRAQRADLQAAAASLAVRRARRHRAASAFIADDLDGLIREVALDQANGLLGKTVIHPSHVAAVHALSVVIVRGIRRRRRHRRDRRGGRSGRIGIRQQDEREQAAHRLGAPHAHPRAGVRRRARGRVVRRPARRRAARRMSRCATDRQWVTERFGAELVDDWWRRAVVRRSSDLALRRNPRRAHLLVSTRARQAHPRRPAMRCTQLV